MADHYDTMTTDQLLAEMCRKLDRIEAQGARKVTFTSGQPGHVDAVQRQLDEVQQAVRTGKRVQVATARISL